MRTIQHVLEQMPCFLKKKKSERLLNLPQLSPNYVCRDFSWSITPPPPPPSPSVTNHDGKSLHVFLAPVSMLTLTRVPSSEPQTSIDFLVSNRTNASLRRLKMTVIIVNMLLRRNIYLDLLYNGAKMIVWLLCLLESCRLRLKSSNVCLSRSSVTLPAAAKELRAEGGISNTGNRHFRAQPREHANKKKRQVLKFWAGFLAASLPRPDPPSRLFGSWDYRAAKIFKS